ncbi:MAG: hypothetical protein M0Z91_02025 [Actinomycetota bacterium]|nr:hypothetical protein [Actinomycetota bacterium]
MKIAAALLGIVLFGLTISSVLRSLVVPGGTITRMTKVTDQLVGAAFILVTLRVRTYARRNAMLAAQPAAVLFVILGAWALSFLACAALLLYPATSGLPSALEEAGSSLVTLGIIHSPGAYATAVDVVTAFTGMIVVALQIAYLPTLYAAYNHRETEVTLLKAEAGQPAWGPEILRRAAMGNYVADLSDIYHSWERWAAEVAETHTSYPILLRYRSPGNGNSWIVSLLAVLDAASMHLALAPEQAPMQARLCVQAGFQALRDIAQSLRIPFDPDPLPTEPISVTRSDFDAAVTRIRNAGFPIERDGADAFRHFQGWRVNYEQVLYRLCYNVDAVPAPWSGARRWKDATVHFATTPNRTPDNPEG